MEKLFINWLSPRKFIMCLYYKKVVGLLLAHTKLPQDNKSRRLMNALTSRSFTVAYILDFRKNCMHDL